MALRSGSVPESRAGWRRSRRSPDPLCQNASMGPAEKLRAAFELHEVGVALMRQNLRRRHPTASDERIEELLANWLRTRPGAEHGDSAGRPSARLRR